MSRKSKDLNWMDVAGVFMASAKLVTRFTRWSNSLLNQSPADRIAQQTLALNAQRLENLQLDARLKTQRAAKVSNEVVMTDARAELDRNKLQAQIKALELKNLELQKKLEAAGVFSPTFQAEGYAEPGDVRRGRMYDSKESNTPTTDGPR